MCGPVVSTLAVAIHFLDGAQPLCAARSQLLGSRDPGEVTCTDCIERLHSMEKDGRLPNPGAVLDLPTAPAGEKIASRGRAVRTASKA